jgi:antitoxin component YwqK of YwqJK toxin-antitoxin module
VNGPSKEYYANGHLNAEGNKIEISEGVDVYDGKVQVYDSAGKLQKTLLYDKGRQVSKSGN